MKKLYRIFHLLPRNIKLLQNTVDRQREGIAIAHKQGKYKGGKRKKVNGFPEGYARYKARQITKAALAAELKISRPTLDKLIKEYETSA